MDNVEIKVLLVEDDEIDRQFVQRFLAKCSQLKFNIELASTLKGAIECLGKADYDIVIADLGLPDSNGIETVKKISEFNPHIPIVVLTGLDDEEIGLQAIKNGAADYLVKGYEKKPQMESALVRTIRYAIERKQAEEKIKQTAQGWRATFDSITDMISIHDKDFKIVRINMAFAKAFNMEPKEVIGKTCYELFHKSNQPPPNCPHCQTLKTKKPMRIEFFEPSLNKHFLISTSPVLDDEGQITGCVHIASDITERKLAEEKIREAMEIKSEFISMVSHELRTPMTSIKEGISIVLEGAAGQINNEQKELLGIAKRNLDRLARLINDVLDFQKLQADKMKFNMLDSSINEAVEEVYKAMLPSVKEKKLDLFLNLDNALPIIKFDVDKIIQVLINLINNAVKFTEKGHIIIATSKLENEIQVSVSDTGCGMKQEDLPRLFHKFEQLGKGEERKTGGTGLGLAISKEIVERHNGKIWVKSEPGEGSIFCFTLPTTEAPIDAELEKELMAH
jgi:PAS domain S-box-containing protein